MNRKLFYKTIPAMLLSVVSVAGYTFLSGTVWAQGSAKKATKMSTITNTTPEGAVRAFLIAGATHNKQALRSIILPVSDAELAGILEGNTPPPDAQKQMTEQISGMPVKILKPGTVVEMVQGRSLTVPASADGKTSVYAQPAGMPIPLHLVKKNGKWLVDSASVLASMKAMRGAANKP